MKIGIDISSITPSRAGVGYYLYSLVLALAKNDGENEYFLFTNNISNIDFTLPSNFKIVEIKKERVDFFWIFSVVRNLRSNKIELFISPANFTFGILFPNTIQIVHDLAPVKYPKYFSKSGSTKYKIQLDLVLRRSRIIATTSETIKDELIKYNPEISKKIYTIGFGIHEWARTQTTQDKLGEVKTKYGLPDKFILSVSTLEPRKNHINMIKGFLKFRERHQDYDYVVVGKKGWFFEEIFNFINNQKNNDSVKFLGYVPQEDLPAIYDLSKGVIMLSFYEGIGLSLTEAVFRNKPALASDIPIFREVLGSSGIYSDPLDENIIANGIENLVFGETKVNPQDMSKYNWNQVAKNLTDLYVRSW